MKQKLFSVWIWTGIGVLILIWLPLLAVVRLFDQDPAYYKTGKLFRKLGLAISRINPNWQIKIEGFENINDRAPYVVVSNHLSNADIPLISNLPWEMKWVAKKELFSIPILGWMMRMAGDIPVDRTAASRRIWVFKWCKYYLDQQCSVMFFPEGTRSRNGMLKKFSTGAFKLAIRENIPVLPLVIDGTQDCLPKKTWIFTSKAYVTLKVLPPVTTLDLNKEDAPELMNNIRQKIAYQLAEWREQPLEKVDATIR